MVSFDLKEFSTGRKENPRELINIFFWIFSGLDCVIGVTFYGILKEE